MLPLLASNSDILSREDVYLGSWVSEQTGKPVVELSRDVEDAAEAEMLGRMFDQEGIFDVTSLTSNTLRLTDQMHYAKRKASICALHTL